MTATGRGCGHQTRLMFSCQEPRLKLAEAFADYFDRKVADIRSATDGTPPPVFRDSPTSDRLSTSIPVTTDVVCTMVRVAADKYSMKDPMPTWLLKTCIDLIALYIASLFNLSLSSFLVPTSYKDAYVIPHLKKPTLPCGVNDQYRICRFFPSYSSGSSVSS